MPPNVPAAAPPADDPAGEPAAPPAYDPAVPHGHVPPPPRGGGGPWPAIPAEASAHVDLPALPVTPSWARQFTHAVLGAWQLTPDLIDTAVLLVSELVSNATAAATAATAPDTPVHLTLRYQPACLVIEVVDPDSSPPVLADPDLDAEAGRGLMLVQALSKEWSYFRTLTDKTVYCVIGTE